MLRRYALITLVALALITQTSSHSRADNPPPGTSTGQKIGTIVSTAINTALPGIGALLTTLWPKKDNGQPKDKASKDEMATAVEGAKKKVLSVALDNLKPVN